MDKFLEYSHIPKLTKEEVENLNSLTTITKVFPQVWTVLWDSY